MITNHHILRYPISKQKATEFRSAIIELQQSLKNLGLLLTGLFLKVAILANKFLKKSENKNTKYSTKEIE